MGSNVIPVGIKPTQTQTQDILPPVTKGPVAQQLPVADKFTPPMAVKGAIQAPMAQAQAPVVTKGVVQAPMAQAQAPVVTKGVVQAPVVTKGMDQAPVVTKGAPMAQQAPMPVTKGAMQSQTSQAPVVGK